MAGCCYYSNVYQKLGNVVSEEQRALYHQRVEEISPSIRYCAYNIGGLPTDVSELMKLQTDAAGSDILAAKIDVGFLFCIMSFLALFFLLGSFS